MNVWVHPRAQDARCVLKILALVDEENLNIGVSGERTRRRETGKAAAKDGLPEYSRDRRQNALEMVACKHERPVCIRECRRAPRESSADAVGSAGVTTAR